MPSKRAKRHHVVPQILQHQFTDAEGKIWYSARNDSNRYSTPDRRSPKGAFWIRDYYTVLEDDKLSSIIESDFYGAVDNFLGRTLPKLNTTLRAKSVPNIATDTLKDLRDVVFEMAKRTPQFIPDYEGDESLGNTAIEEVTKLNREVYGDKEQSQVIGTGFGGQSATAVGRDIRVRATLLPSPKCEEALSELSLRWVSAPPRKSFVLSDVIAYRIGNGGPNGLSNPRFELWMPVSPAHCMVWLRDPNNQVSQLTQLQPSHLRQINEYAARRGSQIASHSRELVSSLSRQK
ncbi:DUF4238 domain-containing protein [Leisingera sp. M658]|uniref:DUF4238 domain-containing protein n=1 Tax=Leisingera sp. M658 TaxID=2867015 RepID=UPI0021A39579|nr:DUF4238 domain-containing protein [Leisingera sp. M658]UWQ75117.1 DUF4238 domain-containing protein [Leisingera sp. M658]